MNQQQRQPGVGGGGDTPAEQQRGLAAAFLDDPELRGLLSVDEAVLWASMFADADAPAGDTPVSRAEVRGMRLVIDTSSEEEEEGSETAEDEGLQDGEAAGSSGACCGAGRSRQPPRRYDPNTTAQHAYLGDIEELHGSFGHLAAGTTARLPLLVLDGVVLFPGCQLPLLLRTPEELELLDRAMAAPAPLTRLLAVACGPRSMLRALPQLVACTAEVRQMQHRAASGGDEGASVAVVAVGQQRCELLVSRRDVQHNMPASVDVRILSEGCDAAVPRCITQHCSAIHPALVAPWDAARLEAAVRRAVGVLLPPVASFHGSPVAFSHYVSHNLPLMPAMRQMLLSAPCAADRLRLLLRLLDSTTRLCCTECLLPIATTADVLCDVSCEGGGGAFVNAHGFVHDLATFRKVRGVRLAGGRETAHSWFPGYAWEICHCGACGQHMGWRFTAVQRGLTPRSFWGIRRAVLMFDDGDAADDDEGGGGSEQHEVAAAGAPHAPH